MVNGSLKHTTRSYLVDLFWRLPYTTRRSIFHVFRPQTFAAYQWLRHPDNQEKHSLRAFDTHKCIFIHIPKTAGISIRRSLFSDFPRTHMDIRMFQLIYPREVFESYFKFAFVRNPYDRLVSAFHYLKKGSLSADGRRWAEANLSGYPDFESFVKGWVSEKNVFSRILFLPQWYFICDRQGHILVDFLGRFERLSEDFAMVADRLQIKTMLQQFNRNQQRLRDYRAYYTDETRRIVETVYARDIQVLGYEF